MSTAQFVTSKCITADKHDFILFEAENELDFTDSLVRPFLKLKMNYILPTAWWDLFTGGADSMFPG